MFTLSFKRFDGTNVQSEHILIYIVTIKDFLPPLLVCNNNHHGIKVSINCSALDVLCFLTPLL